MKESYLNDAFHIRNYPSQKRKVRFCSCFKREQMTSAHSSSPQAKHAPRMHCACTAAVRMSDAFRQAKERPFGHKLFTARSCQELAGNMQYIYILIYKTHNANSKSALSTKILQSFFLCLLHLGHSQIVKNVMKC